MKIKDLKNYGIPSYFINIWKKQPSPYLLPLQEDAVKNYGVLDCGEGSMRLPRRDAPRNDKKEKGRMQYASTRMGSRVRGNVKRGNGNDIKGSTGLPRRDAPRNDKVANNNLLVIAPTSSGKSFIGEMAAISRVSHYQKVIYLLPLRSPAEKKYRHLFKSKNLPVLFFTAIRQCFSFLISVHLKTPL